MNSTNEKKLNNKGITLIALIITIIVLLILAGITIATLAGDNGLIQKVGEAKDKTYEAEAKEKEELENMEDIFYEDSYILGLLHNNEIKKYYSTENMIKTYFILQNAENEYYFRNFLNLYISEGTSGQKLFSEDATSGILCDKNGLSVCGWMEIDEDTGEIKMDIAQALDITYEIEGKKRVGTQIMEDGKIMAIFDDNTKEVIGQIVLNYTSLGRVFPQNDSDLYKADAFDGIGLAVEEVNGIIKKINSSKANAISEYNKKIRENPYTLSIKDQTQDYYFIAKDINNNNYEYSKNNLELYMSNFVDGNGNVSHIVPFVEEGIASNAILCDSNGKPIMVYKVDENSGEINYDEEPTECYIQGYSIDNSNMEYIEHIKTVIKDNGKIYGIDINGNEHLVGQIAISTSNTSLQLTTKNPKIEITKP